MSVQFVHNSGGTLGEKGKANRVSDIRDVAFVFIMYFVW